MAEAGCFIQPRGWLIVCDDQAREIRRHSDNLAEIFPHWQGPFLGAAPRDLLGSDQSHRLRNLLSRFTGPAHPALAGDCRFPGVELAYDATVHFNGDEAMLAFEPAGGEGRLEGLDRARALIDRLSQAKEADELVRKATLLAGAALDAEHTFFLAFAGAETEVASAYRRLGAPPSAPERARAFFPGRCIHAIGDVEAPDRAVLSKQGMADFDLSLSALRAADEPLRLWLRGQNFRSAVFVPVAEGERIFGMIVALGREPRWPALALRAALEIFADVLALRLGVLLPPHAQAEPPEPEDKPLRVLIVEDRSLIAMQLAASLSECGAIVAGVCGSVQQALDGVEHLNFDVALLDFQLGEDDALPVAGVLAARGKPFVFASGYGDDLSLPQEFADRPKVGKPYETEQILAVLKAARDAES